ncbi:tol-pal system-associated acyl-CoA thioesterase [Verticiella sediminum]|uniref:Tol-pal system-associated acyl-CoA thioesterase n=1 Tax=Verticiella sediminum TaxID=1247510 RepID=A0A556B143_9BURK|nr:tol-pal system-associated acyl-CoA thioesterase [Verticiella sediminum]TSH98864.1 tol-pal system-associated acyl-CoA thioesterase [Verticiella sediminum]
MSVVPRSDAAFRFTVRVYYEDTDAGGVVYYANYLKFFERARTEWLRALGFDQSRTAATSGSIFVVRSARTDYHRPARLDDTLSIASRIARVGRASMTFMQSCERDGETLVTAEVDVACVNATSLRPVAMPGEILQALRASTAAPGRGAAS